MAEEAADAHDIGLDLSPGIRDVLYRADILVGAVAYIGPTTFELSMSPSRHGGEIDALSWCGSPRPVVPPTLTISVT